MKQILIIDDDETICTLLYQLFSENNFFAFYTTDIDEANILINYISMDCLLVDYMMPKQNGIDFLKKLKQNNIMIPSIMLTAIDDIDNKLTALEYASDDYLAKPFHSKELLLRVNNLIKKDVDIIYGNSSSIKIGELLFDMQNLSLKIHNTPIALSDQEAQILMIFVNNINEILTKEFILKELNKPITQINLNSLNVSVMRLRKKIEVDIHNPQYIKTIRNKGFVLNSR